MNDNEIKQLFRQNQSALPDDAGFQREVWQKIAQSKPDVVSLALAWRKMLDFLTRPLVGLPLGLACIAASALLAFYHGVESREQTWVDLSMNYHHWINPLSHHR
jgi:hypothetical protein